MTLALLTREQLDVRLLEGHRLRLVHEEPDAVLHCRVMCREEEVPMAIFTEYRNLGLLRCVGDSDLYG